MRYLVSQWNECGYCTDNFVGRYSSLLFCYCCLSCCNVLYTLTCNYTLNEVDVKQYYNLQL